MDANGIPLKLAVLASCLEEDQFLHTIETLWTILNNVKSDPDNEKFRKLRTENKTFSTRVWVHGAACDIMKLLGWKQVGDLVVLTDYDEEAFDVALKTLLEYINKSSKQEVLSSEPKHLVQQQVSHSSVAANLEYQKRMEWMKEQRRKTKEEKRRIAAQIKADRQEADTRENKPSHARQMKFGSNLARFEDIGVDLNKGGG